MPEPLETLEPTGSADPGPDTMVTGMALSHEALALYRGASVVTLPPGTVAGINGGDYTALFTGATAGAGAGVRGGKT